MIPKAGQSIKQSVREKWWEVIGEQNSLQNLVKAAEPYQGKYYQKLSAHAKTKVCEALSLYNTQGPAAISRTSIFGRSPNGAQYIDTTEAREKISKLEETLRRFKLVESAEGYDDFIESFETLLKAFKRLQANVDARGVKFVEVAEIFPGITLA